jgi:hypothetical protein
MCISVWFVNCIIEGYKYKTFIFCSPLGTGLATSFFNDKNRNLVRDLVELIVETKQELPSWLDSMASDQRMPQTSRRSGGGGGGGGGGAGKR